ncbi:type I-E CRISPR-associated endoribonuclease Cas2e [Lactobacillus sp. ESL0731]|uniref:type I-E CRISPR-associated endoribonuclease Cas2e n=1 Tax=unclassified Lactobacillus TaxID=2620435 RepID=UPI0023F7B721|nr:MULTISPECIES: type I-E CRISPR-associated endoribonuclease Cas2e [unclassified Lactobacillus]WEV51046.1 type I-E CRISPR-associated endoribonuclease Cas2e [Lactobacillus sp. ESL0700]WEV62176.1 type I-E CRISPR-associated endoribonuclease Cas2e [Lactobacillus sp. ESL0731]
MIVVTLTKVPQSLRGDLTKWYQEVQTGVYVGNVSARIRDLLWQRVEKNIGSGEATMVYSTNTELGYEIKTTRRNYDVVDYDGIPLVMRLNVDNMPQATKYGFSNAAKFHRAKVMAHNQKKVHTKISQPEITVLDLETTGLKAGRDQIIAIGAIKKLKDGSYQKFDQLIKIDQKIPKPITELTGITEKMLADNGIPLSLALVQLKDFIKSSILMGYNFHFDETFLSSGLVTCNLAELDNKTIDLMAIVKKTEKFLDNYQLATVLKFYNIENLQPHNALSDAQATMELANKLIKNGRIKF